MAKTKKIFISGNTPSSKNGKRIVRMGKFSKLINSALVMSYKDRVKIEFEAYRKTFRDVVKGKPLPYHIKLTFVRDSKRRFDFNNASQVIFDLMQEYKWLPDDSYKYVVPVFSPQVIVDKEKAGVFIEVL
jgi:Holliday junction resolvase RusA-like endonuclease